MFKNYLKIALRNLMRHKGYSFINIVGLAIGLACCILILLWVQHELSYDRFHKNANNIYRVVEMQQQSGEPFPVAVTPSPLGPAMLEDFPEVVNFTRFQTYFFGYMKNEGERFKANITLADPSIFDIFSFPIIAGDRKVMFDDLFNVAISEDMAERYFGDENPLGKTLQVNNSTDIKVTGIFQNVSDNSHLDFDFIVPFEVLKKLGGNLEEWGSNSYYTYVQLQENVDWQDFDRKIEGYLEEHEVDYPVKLNLQPLKQIHLFSNYVADIGGHGSIVYVRIFSMIAAFILLIACINFMNLSTARSTKRAKEVGMRKVVGSCRKNLITQFFGESILLAILAMLIALALVEITLPYFNDIHGKDLSLLKNMNVLLLLVGITISTGLVSGIYPAILLSSFKPVTVLKGSISSGSKKGIFRKILVIVQFSLSIILIISTIIIHKQLNYIFKSDVGFNREQVLSFTSYNFPDEQLDTFKNELRKISSVKSLSTSSQYPTNFATSGYGFSWKGLEEDARILIHTLQVDYDFFETFEMEMVAGRSFSREFSTDTLGFVINEKAAEIMGFDNPTEETLHYRYDEISGPVIGVVKNFNFKHIRNKVEPLVIKLVPDMSGVIHLKLKAENMSDVIVQIKKIWEEFVPDYPFDYHFLDDQFQKMYQAEKQMSKIFDFFTAFAIFISCLGLFGLASFMTEQRFKEIGIRKVLGASIPNIVFLLTKEFTKWVLIANIISWPLAWFAMNKWLQSFAYKTTFELWIFLLAGITALAIALITISFRSFKAANSNPVKALKYE